MLLSPGKEASQPSHIRRKSFVRRARSITNPAALTFVHAPFNRCWCYSLSARLILIYAADVLYSRDTANLFVLLIRHDWMNSASKNPLSGQSCTAKFFFPFHAKRLGFYVNCWNRRVIRHDDVFSFLSFSQSQKGSVLLLSRALN